MQTRHTLHRGVFITGSDTAAGKTLVAAGLMRALRTTGASALGMKPIATDCIRDASGLRNADALLLQATGSESVPYDWINPYAFERPIAPHLAAADCDVRVQPDVLRQQYQRLGERADWVVVEGVGGWHVPLGDALLVSDLPAVLGASQRLPVILVVGLQLGCLNHALLSAAAIAADGCQLAGWVATQTDPDMLAVDGNIATLKDRIPAPCLGTLPYLADPDPRRIAGHLRLDALMQ